MPLGSGICYFALQLLCSIGILAKAPFWYVFVLATELGCCNSKGPARHDLSGPS